MDAAAIEYNYTAMNKAGHVTKGKISARDRAAALSAITKRELIPVLLVEAAGTGINTNLSLQTIPGLSKLNLGSKVKTKDKVIFSRQFATMINAGVPIAQSLAILQKQAASPKLQEVIGEVVKRVEGGMPLSGALAEHGDVFPPVYVNMVKAGEAGGILDQVLDRLATQQEKDAEIVTKVKGASIYPGVISTAAVAAFIFLMTVIIPKLAVIFEGFGTKLPVYTRVMLSVSAAMRHYGLVIFAILAAIVIAILRWHKTPVGKRFFDQLFLRAPIIGPIITNVNIARFARTFGSLMSSGLAVLDSLKVTAEALNNTLFKEELTKLAAEVKNGRSISEPLLNSKIFPPIVSQMIAVGEETGQIDKIMLKMAEFYEKEVDAVVSNLTSVLEPVLIILLGVMVGSIVLSVFGPIAQLTQSVG